MIPDDHHDSLEARLRALRPIALPSLLQNHLLAVEPPPIKHRAPWRFLPLAGSLAVTAAVLWMIALATGRHEQPPAQASVAGPPPASEPRVFVPTSERSTLLGVSEGEVVDAGSDRQVRLVRAVWLDDTTYVGADHSILHRRTTRTEIVPVALETL